MELYLRVRLAVSEGMTQRQAAKHFNVSRDSVAKMLSYSTPPGYQRFFDTNGNTSALYRRSLCSECYRGSRPRHRAAFGSVATPPSQMLEVRVAQNAVKEDAPVEALPLIDVLATLSRRRVNCLAAAMSAILSARLSVWLVPGQLPLMARLRVRDFAVVSQLLQGEAETAGFCDMPADVRSVSSVLDLSKASVLLLRRGEFLPSNPTLADVFSFREAFVSSSEVQRRLRIAGEVRHPTYINNELELIGSDKIGAKRRRTSIALRERAAVEAYYGNRLAARV
ncbi:hypothetical protein [Neorhizobium sp. P12A]|uniref:hypothetical protein n=1 Tax=Neorhizobium sp. P12A TaxID=2268027 RepID=UPI0011ED6B79|nr:hypothetical protein [Neorhizobium sp. P12A]